MYDIEIMSLIDLGRLIEKQEIELELIDGKIKLWTQYNEDYSKLKKMIMNMQEKVRYPHNIPIAGSKLAFVPGHIIHTNEITVLLGDNLFAVRSAKQSVQIIDRRVQNVKHMLEQSEEARRKTQDWLKATREHKQDKEELVEIIETM